MARERIISGGSLGADDEQFNRALRPIRLDDCIGPPESFEKIRIALTAAKQRAEPMEHVLLHGPPGLGKTTLAHVIANEMATHIRVTSGPALARPSDVMGVLTNLERNDVLFIDEIHRLPIAVEEFLYPAIEEFKVDFTVDSGPHARVINIPLKPFTLIGATTRAGLISAPLRTRFGIVEHLDFWDEVQLVERIKRSAQLLKVTCDPQAISLLARRARGTPRIANRLLRRVRDFAQVKGNGEITVSATDEALKLEGVDHLGLDSLDRKYLAALIDTYDGGPAGVEAIAATLSEARDTLEDVVEPFLLRIGLVARTKQGRLATPVAYEHLGRTRPAQKTSRADEPTLFDDNSR